MNLLEAYRICAKKAHLHFSKMDNGLFEPSECTDGDYYGKYPADIKFADQKWYWLTSMITGMAPLLYQTGNDEDALKWAEQYSNEYADKVFRPYTQTMHDLGFLYLPYSVHMYKITGNQVHRDAALRAADELAKRFNVRGGFIEAWDEMNIDNREGRMIVDSSMNVPLLYWAWKETGHYFYKDVADMHLDTIISTLVRDDYSVAHAWMFDSHTGKPKHEANSCGFADGSHWARGTAWVVFGLAMAYDYTNNKKYLDIAIKIADKYLECMGAELIPVWDFRLPVDLPAKICTNVKGAPAQWDESDLKNTIHNVDTSAAAIMVCGMQSILKHSDKDNFREYIDNALLKLSNEYLDTDNLKTGILHHSNGREVYSAYGDYFYMLALARNLFNIDTCWDA